MAVTKVPATAVRASPTRSGWAEAGNRGRQRHLRGKDRYQPRAASSLLLSD
jgi:hypothetical protein